MRNLLSGKQAQVIKTLFLTRKIEHCRTGGLSVQIRRATEVVQLIAHGQRTVGILHPQGELTHPVLLVQQTTFFGASLLLDESHILLPPHFLTDEPLDGN